MADLKTFLSLAMPNQYRLNVTKWNIELDILRPASPNLHDPYKYMQKNVILQSIGIICGNKK